MKILLKKETVLYGGDADSDDYLDDGDTMTTELFNEAMGLLLQIAYITETKIDVMMTAVQMRQITPRNKELLSMIFYMPIKIYFSEDYIQEARLSCGEEVIFIHTIKN